MSENERELMHPASRFTGNRYRHSQEQHEPERESAIDDAYQPASLDYRAGAGAGEHPVATDTSADLSFPISTDTPHPEALPPLTEGQLPAGTMLGNRYCLKGRLGKGGFGEAYLADDTRLNRRCIVKRAAPNPQWNEQKRAVVLSSFRREAQFLVSLNSPGHPNIPEIYEYLDDDHCLVMKYIAGRNFWQVLAHHGGRLPAADALRYATAVCSALVYMHSRTPEPVLHRDIKPGNLLVDAEDRVWVIDFGLARAIAPEATEAEQFGGGMGTRGYTPSEQWRGKAEPRSDVYALAATLYEFLAGRLSDGNQYAVLQQMSGGAESPLGHLHPAIRDEVEHLLLRGLQPAVTERPTAQEFLDHLQAIQKRLSPITPPRPATPPDVAGFVGREDDLARFAHAVQAHQPALITGMAGVGKTALAARLIARLAAEQRYLPQHIFWHQFYEHDGVAGMIRNLAAFLAHYGQPDGWSMWNSVQESADPQRLLDIFHYLLHQIITQGSYLLCLDDLWHVEHDPLLDDVGSQLFQYAQEGHIALIIVSRTMPAFVPGVADPLDGLGRADTAALLQNRGVALAETLIEELQTRTEGNAQLLILAMDMLQHSRSPERQIARLSETTNIQNYLLVEVDKSLSERERAMMQAVAVLLGYPGSRNAIVAVSDTKKGATRTLNALSERYLLTSTSEGDTYQQHAIVQEFYYRMLEEDEDEEALTEMHQRAGEFYEHDDEEQDMLKAAIHFERAAEEAHAAELVSGDTTSMLITQGRTRPLYMLLQALKKKKKLDPRSRIRVATALADTCTFMREVEAAEHAYLQGFALLATLGDTTMMHEYKARICEGLGTVLSRSQPRKALEWIEQGLRDLHGIGTTAEGRLWLGKGSALLFIGEKEAAAQALQCALACLPADASELRTRTLINLGNICCEQGESEAGQQYYTQALQLCDATGNILDKAVIATNLAVEICVSGDWAGAIAELQRALALAEAVGNRETQAILASNLGYISTTLGDLEAARASFMHSIELLERYQFSRYLIDTYTSLAHLHIRAGEWEAAAAALSRAEQCIQDTDATCALSEIQRGRAHIALAGGHPEEAHTAALQALQHAEQADPREEGMSLEVLATCLAALGQPQQAITALHRSLEVLTPYPYETALAQMALARILLQAGCEYEQHAALQPHTLLEQARATFERLGAQHDLAALELLQCLSLQQQEDETMPP